MRKMYAVMAAIILALSIGVTAMAQGKGVQKRTKGGCSDCITCNVSPEQVRTFKRDTIDLRQELMNKRFDLQREQLKETPDSTRTATLEADIAALKDKIEAQRKAANLPESICNGRDCPLMGDDCGKCGSGKGCDSSCCGKGSCAPCKECRDCQYGKKGGNCATCRDCGDCSCPNCSHKADCAKCGKKQKPSKVGCDKCNKK